MSSGVEVAFVIVKIRLILFGLYSLYFCAVVFIMNLEHKKYSDPVRNEVEDQVY